ncbi:hypothetical protein Dimus_038107 [Dionaea muscipula]
MGEHIRMDAPVRDVGWKKLEFGIRESIIQRVGKIFELSDYKNDMDLRCIIDKKCGVLYRNWKNKLHAHYKRIKKEMPNPKSHPLYPCKSDDWTFMIKKVWTKKAFKEINETRQQSFSERFKDTHIRNRHANQEYEVWINDKVKEHYDTIVAKIDEQSQPNVINPRSEQEIFVEVLGKITGYLKGYGIHMNTRATKSQRVLNSEVITLKQVVDDQAKVVMEQAKLIADYKINMENMMFMATKCGVDPATIPRFTSNDKDEADTLI